MLYCFLDTNTPDKTEKNHFLNTIEQIVMTHSKDISRHQRFDPDSTLIKANWELGYQPPLISQNDQPNNYMQCLLFIWLCTILMTWIALVVSIKSNCRMILWKMVPFIPLHNFHYSFFCDKKLSLVILTIRESKVDLYQIHVKYLFKTESSLYVLSLVEIRAVFIKKLLASPRK